MSDHKEEKRAVLAESVDLPPLRKVNLRHVKITSDEDQYSTERIERALFLNKFDNDNFNAKLMTDRQRSIFVKMFELQTPLKE